MNGPIFFIKNTNIRILPEALELCVHLKLVTQNQLEWIILVEDSVYSPFHLKPRLERKIMASRRIWPKYKDFDPEQPGEDVNKEKLRIFKLAQEEYLSLTFDSRRFRIQILNDRLQTLSQKLYIEDKLTELKNITTTINYFEGLKEELMAQISKDEDEFGNVELGGGKALSFIEKLKRNKEERTRHKSDEINFER